MTNMLIDEILDMMDDLLDEAATVPFSNKKAIIDSDKMRDCINDLRLNLPNEKKNAKHIVHDRQEIVSDANKEAEQIIRRAEERAKMINASDFTFLCLPDAAAIEAANLCTNPKTRILDASTAHRTNPDR